MSGSKIEEILHTLESCEHGRNTGMVGQLLTKGQCLDCLNMETTGGYKTKRAGRTQYNSTPVSDSPAIMSLAEYVDSVGQWYLMAQTADGRIMAGHTLPPDSGDFALIKTLSDTTPARPAMMTAVGGDLVVTDGDGRSAPQVWSGAGVNPAMGLLTEDGDASYSYVTFSDNSRINGCYLQLGGLGPSGSYLYLGFYRPFQGIKFNLAPGYENQDEARLIVDYYHGQWSFMDISDGTASEGKCFSQSGEVTWSPPSDWQAHQVTDIHLYWVRFCVSASLSAEVRIPCAQVICGMTDLMNRWDGRLGKSSLISQVIKTPNFCQVFNSTVELTDGNSNTRGNFCPTQPCSAGTQYYGYIGYEQRFRGLSINLVCNNSDPATIQVEYYDQTLKGWQAVANLYDGTAMDMGYRDNNDDFTAADGTAPDSGKWSVVSGNPVIASNQLRCSALSGNVAVKTTMSYHSRGAARVDWVLNTAPTVTGWYAGMVAVLTYGHDYKVRVSRSYDTTTGQVCRVDFFNGTSWSNAGMVSSAGNSGTFLLSRSREFIYCYIYNGSGDKDDLANYTQVGASPVNTGLSLPCPLRFQLEAVKEGSAGPDVSWNNYAYVGTSELSPLALGSSNGDAILMLWTDPGEEKWVPVTLDKAIDATLTPRYYIRLSVTQDIYSGIQASGVGIIPVDDPVGNYRFCLEFDGRLVLSGKTDADRVIAYTESQYPESGLHYFSLPRPVTALARLERNLVIFTTGDIYLCSSESFPVNNKRLGSDHVGCFSPLSLVLAEGRLYWFDIGSKAFWRAGSAQFYNDVAAPEKVSRPIDDLVAQINPAAAHMVTGVYYAKKREIWWNVPCGDGQTTNNRVLVLNFETGWHVYDHPLASLARVSGKDYLEYLVGGGYDNGLAYVLDHSLNDMSVAVDGYFVTRDLTCDLPGWEKDFRFIYLSALDNAGTTLHVSAALDGSDNFSQLGELDLTNGGSRQLDVGLRGRSIRFKFMNNQNDQNFELIYLVVGYRIIRIYGR
ncbi:MAG: hypothetical protein HQK60_04315 [Deltaproteobacteria bacterium]|nr:hypothetical protein [Deltaproteobacteria bacterium]